MNLNKKVFVLGSGFSASMGLPTLNNLFQQIIEYPARFDNDKEEVLSALEVLYPHFTRKVANSYPPFEEFLSIVNSAEDFSSDEYPTIYEEGYWQNKNRSALRLLTDFISGKCKEAENNALLEKFITSLRYGDVIITFNWDNLVERMAFKKNLEINLSERSSNAISILKLHGSINWSKVPNDFRLQNHSCVRWLTTNIFHTIDYTYQDNWIPLNIPPYIIPPISSKSFAKEPFLLKIWHEAFNSLVEAQDICFIGYSLPEQDFQARTLFVSVPRKEIKYKVIDPDPSIGGKYFSLVNPNIEFVQSYFSEETLKLIF